MTDKNEILEMLANATLADLLDEWELLQTYGGDAEYSAAVEAEIAKRTK